MDERQAGDPIPPQAMNELVAKCIEDGVIHMEWPGVAGTIQADHKDTTEPHE